MRTRTDTTGGGSSLSLETNGVPNGDQTLLNLVQGTGILITDDGLGNVTITNTGAGSIGGSIATNQVAFASAANTLAGTNNLTYVASTGILLASFGGNAYFTVNPATDIYALGGYLGGGLGNALVINNGAGNQIYFQGSSGKRFLYDGGTSIYQMGDIDGQDNSGLLTLNDATASLVYSVGSGLPNVWLQVSPALGVARIGLISGVTVNNNFIEVDESGNAINMYGNIAGFASGANIFQFKGSSSTWTIGDVTGAMNGTNIQIDDANQIFTVGNGTNYFKVDVSNRDIFIGDYSGSVNSTVLEVNDASKGISLAAGGITQVFDPASGSRMLSIDMATGIIDFGDVDSLFLGGYIELKTGTGTANSNGLEWDFGANFLHNVLDPVLAQDAATKAYVDSFLNGLQWKTSVRVATLVNGTLATDFENGDLIDGVTLITGDRILIKNQTTQTENGIYTVNASGAPTRATDADTGAELVNATCLISLGSQANTGWTQTTASPITIGVSNIVFVQFTNSVYTNGAGLTLTGNVFALDLNHANTWNALQTFNSGDLRLAGATSGFLTINAASVTTSHTLTMPGAQGANFNVLHDNGSGALYWGLIDLTTDVTGVLPFANLSMVGLIEEIDFEDSSSGIAAQTYTLTCYAHYGYTIDLLKIIADAGTATAALKINGTSVTGISAVGVSSTIATGTASALNTVVAGDIVTLVITSTSSLNNLKASIKTTRT